MPPQAPRPGARRKASNRRLSPSIRRPHRGRLALYAALLALVPVLLAWFHLSHPYFYHFRLLKMAMYALVLLLPVTAEIGLGSAGIRFPGDVGTYLLTFLISGLVFYALLHAYFRLPRRRFLLWLGAGLGIYLTISLVLLW